MALPVGTSHSCFNARSIAKSCAYIHPGFILVIPSEVMEGMLGHASILYCMLITYKVDNHQTNPFLTELVTKLY